MRSHGTARQLPERCLVFHLVRDEGVAGSNPATPTKFPEGPIATGPDMGNETPYRLLGQHNPSEPRDQMFCCVALILWRAVCHARVSGREPESGDPTEKRIWLGMDN